MAPIEQYRYSWVLYILQFFSRLWGFCFLNLSTDRWNWRHCITIHIWLSIANFDLAIKKEGFYWHMKWWTPYINIPPSLALFRHLKYFKNHTELSRNLLKTYPRYLTEAEFAIFWSRVVSTGALDMRYLRLRLRLLNIQDGFRLRGGWHVLVSSLDYLAQSLSKQ